jgi:ubiquinone/menaquinone biosynthesis C-methylase UbiE
MSKVKENKAYVSPEYLKKVAKEVDYIKKRASELMQIKADSQVLDIGCGPASDTISMSEYIGVNGRIVGIDNDPDMVEKANLEVKQRNITKNIVHMQGNAQKLPFTDGEFDCVHAERLLQVLPESASTVVFAELNRVLKRNGRMVLVDSDWGSGSINFSDSLLERRLMEFFATKLRPNGFAGRQLLGLLKNSCFEEVSVEVFPHLARNFKETPFCDWLTREALAHKIASKQEMDMWNQELTEKTVQGAYLSYVSMVIVAGTKK